MSLQNDIIHYGIKRRSGRYPWGSGEHPYQSEGGLKSSIKRKLADVNKIISGLTDKESRNVGANYYKSDFKRGDIRNIELSYRNSKPIAFAVTQIPSYTKQKNNSFVEVDVAVLPQYRNQGIAKNLILQSAKHVKENYTQVKDIHMTFDKDNASALKVARSLGFKERTDVKPGDYGGYEHLTYIMVANVDDLIKRRIQHGSVETKEYIQQIIDDIGGESLIHYGIKRRSGRYPWGSGEHPYQSEKGAPHQAERKAKKEKPPPDPVKMKRAEMIKSKNLHNMSPEDLQKMINRLKQEKELKNLVEADIAPGKKVIKDIMADVGKQTAKEVLAGSVRYGIYYSLQNKETRKFNSEDLARAIYPKLKKEENKKKKDD